jgi:hypothetical protein
VLIECSHCGAPLNVKADDSLTRCCYCGRPQRVRTARTTMQHTPANWHPPPQWIPPPQFAAQSIPLRFDPSKTVRKIVILIAVVSVMTGIVPIACVTCAVIGSVASSSNAPPRKPAEKPDRTPPSTTVPGASPKALEVCKKAKKCCEVATPEMPDACVSIAEANMVQACEEALKAFRQTAKARGRSCD